MGMCYAKPPTVAAASKKRSAVPAGSTPEDDEERDSVTPLDESITQAKKRAQKAWQEYAHARELKNAPRLSALRRAQELDLAFLVDSTSSMQRHITLVKEKISATVAAVRARFPSSRVRVAFIGYRDYEEAIDRISFTSDVDAFKTSMTKVRATGGGDAPEDVFSGLEEAALLEWTSAARIIVHIADAPCHGRDYHNSELKDDHPDGDKKKRDLAQILRALYEDKRIQTYHFYHLGEYTKKMVAEFRKVAGVPAEWIQEDTFSNLEHIPSRISSHSLSAIRSSLLRESDTAAASRRGYSSRTVDSIEPNWEQIIEREGEELAIQPITAEELVESIRYSKRLKLESRGARRLKIAPKPFSADGALRWPYYTLVGAAEDGPTTKRVLKRFKTPLDPRAARQRQSEVSYKEQAEEQFAAAVLVKRFNELCPEAVRERLEFLQLNLLKVEIGNRGLKSHYYTVEDYLDGQYKKFSCNVGEITPEYSDVLQTFTHWTYEFSEGELMITDLQGIKGPDSNTYYLTDPAIHCRDIDHFSRLNWGQEGFDMFFAAHKCNHLCKKLKLKARGGSSPRSALDSPFK